VWQLDCPPRVARKLVTKAQRLRVRQATRSDLWFPAGEYRTADGKVLCLASAAMYRMNAASTLVEICKRADVPIQQWTKWKRAFGERQPWVLGWLRGIADPPKGTRLLSPARQRRMTRPPTGNEFPYSEEMRRFQRNALPAGIESAAACQRGRWVRLFRRKLKLLEWKQLEAWMLRGEAVETITMITATQAERMARAWKVADMLKTASPPLHRGTFDGSIREKLPSQGFAYWLAWVFGGDDPPGWYLVPEKVLKLKQRWSLQGRADAAGIDRMTMKYRLSHRIATDTFDDAVADTLGVSEWGRCQEEARRIGGEQLVEALRKFVDGDCGHKENGARRVGPDGSGVIALGLFVPGPAMLAFRKRARMLRSRERLNEIEVWLREHFGESGGADLYRQLLCNFVLRDCPAGKRFLKDEREETYSDPTPRSVVAANVQGAFHAKGKNTGGRPRKFDPIADAKLLTDFRSSDEKTYEDFFLSRGFPEADWPELKATMCRARVAASRAKNPSG
jgi:hypothetical protein